MNFKIILFTMTVGTIAAIASYFGNLAALRQSAPNASIRSPEEIAAIAPPSVSPSPLPSPPPAPPPLPASPQVVAESPSPQALQDTPEQAVRDYFSLLTDYQFEQARQYLAPGWNVSAEKFRRNWIQYERGSLRVIQMDKTIQLPNNQVSIAFTWRGQIKNGQDYGESWRCVLKPYGDSYLFDRCGPAN